MSKSVKMNELTDLFRDFDFEHCAAGEYAERAYEILNKWEPIKTAPKDGTRILVTDCKVFAAAYWYTVYKSKNLYKDLGRGFPEYAGPNPDADKIDLEFWMWDNPSAFETNDELTADDDGAFEHSEATHWMPILKPPK